MDAAECSERTAWEAREDGQQSKTAVTRGKGCISLEVARQLSFYFRCCCCYGGEMHESEISCIVHTAGRTEIDSDSFLRPDVVFIYAVFLFFLWVSGGTSYLQQTLTSYDTYPATYQNLAGGPE